MPEEHSATHARIDSDALKPRDVYRLMTDLVAPRPIAWVSTTGEDGTANLAPFSYFQGVCSAPPTIILAISWNADGTPKDTLRNILATRELTISHVGRPLAEAMNETSRAYPPHHSEWEFAHVDGAPLRKAPSRFVSPPWVEQAQAALECKLVHAIPLGRGSGRAARTPSGLPAPSSTLVIAEVLCFWVASTLVRRSPRGDLLAIEPAQLASVGRLGGIAYTEVNATFELPRPVAERIEKP